MITDDTEYPEFRGLKLPLTERLLYEALAIESCPQFNDLFVNAAPLLRAAKAEIEAMSTASQPHVTDKGCTCSAMVQGPPHHPACSVAPVTEDAVERVRGMILDHTDADMNDANFAAIQIVQALGKDEGLRSALEEIADGWKFDDPVNRLVLIREKARKALEALSSGEMDAYGPTTLDTPTKEQ